MSDGDVSCTAPPTRNSSLQILFKCLTPAIAFESTTQPSLLWRCRIHCACHEKKCEHGVLAFTPRSTAACTFWEAQLPKVLRAWGAFKMFTWKCTCCHSHVHFFNISTSKSAPNMVCVCVFVCFVRFDFEMCFAPQTRALFEQLNFQKCAPNLKCFRILTSQCASGTVARIFWSPSTRRFSEPTTFRPSRATKHWKNKEFCNCSTFSRTSIFFPHALFSASSHNCGYFFQSACTTLYSFYINSPHCFWLLEPPWHSHTRHHATQKNRKIRKSSGFLMRYNEKTGQYIPEALWHLVTKADPSCLDRHIMARWWIVHPCSFLIVLSLFFSTGFLNSHVWPYVIRSYWKTCFLCYWIIICYKKCRKTMMNFGTYSCSLNLSCSHQSSALFPRSASWTQLKPARCEVQLCELPVHSVVWKRVFSLDGFVWYYMVPYGRNLKNLSS